MNKALVVSVFVAAALALPLFAALPAAAPLSNPYSIRIVSPARNAALSTLGVRMTVAVAGGFILNEADFGGVLRAGEGHIRYSVDGARVNSTWLTVFDFPTLAAGTRTLSAQLVDNQDQPLTPLVYDEIIVTAGPPSIKVLEPVKDSVVSSLGFRLQVAVTNFTLSAQDNGSWNVPGEGHIHVMDVVGTNEMLKGMMNGTTTEITGWSNGLHTLKVELYNNNHTELPTEYSESVNFTIADPTITLATADAVEEGKDLLLTWTVTGFVLDPGAFGGAAEAGRGHVHIFVDGTYKAATAATSYSLTGLALGQHTIKVVLYNNDHTALPTEYSASKTITVAAAGTITPSGATGVSASVFYGSVGFLILVILILIAMLMRKPRGGTTSPPKET